MLKQNSMAKNLQNTVFPPTMLTVIFCKSVPTNHMTWTSEQTGEFE